MHTILTVPRPATAEYAPFYAGYVARVSEGQAVELLDTQLGAVPRLFHGMEDERAGFRYAPEKWSIKEVVGHLSDTERLLSGRMVRIARADQTPLPGFDENAYVRVANFDGRTLEDLLAEWIAVRGATLALVRGVSADVWVRSGVANGHPVSARALLYIIPGHVEHHVEILRTRYGVTGAGVSG